MLQQLLSLRHAHVASRHLQLKKPEAQCERWFTAPWDEMVAAHLRYDFTHTVHSLTCMSSIKVLVKKVHVLWEYFICLLSKHCLMTGWDHLNKYDHRVNDLHWHSNFRKKTNSNRIDASTFNSTRTCYRSSVGDKYSYLYCSTTCYLSTLVRY